MWAFKNIFAIRPGVRKKYSKTTISFGVFLFSLFQIFLFGCHRHTTCCSEDIMLWDFSAESKQKEAMVLLASQFSHSSQVSQKHKHDWMGVLAGDLAISNPSTGIAAPSHPIYSLFVLFAVIWWLKLIRLDREEQFTNHLHHVYFILFHV